MLYNMWEGTVSLRLESYGAVSLSICLSVGWLVGYQSVSQNQLVRKEEKSVFKENCMSVCVV